MSPRLRLCVLAASLLFPSRSMWPMTKLEAKMRDITVGPRGHAVVLTTGAMNPMHKGHLQMLHQAASCLEAEGYSIAGGWLSPSHDGYVLPKCQSLGTVGLSARFRIEVARRACREHGEYLVDVGEWE